MIERIGRFLAFKFRKRRRYRAKSGLYAVFENNVVGNQIGDIGMGGLSYYYIDNGSKPKKDEYGLTLISGNRQKKVHVSCKTVCDLEAGQMVSQNRCIKRRCVSFQRLNRQQKQKLRNIIRDETFGLY